MWEDPIVAEVHRIREKLAAKFDFDVKAIFADLRKRQTALGDRLVPQKKHAEPTAQADRGRDCGSQDSTSSEAGRVAELGSLDGVRAREVFMFQPQNKERFEKLRTLSPLAAVQAWLDGGFGIGDEPALIFSIRKDSRVTMPDDDIINAMCDAMDDGLDASECLERLAK
ncbi:MAG: hypothetical protein AB7U20_11230 [Planctomycetaceae bacterium]